MNFKKHYELEGLHAFLSPSKYFWVNDTVEELRQRWKKFQNTERGTQLHEWARQSILLRRRQPRSKDSICQYINDAIDFHMTPEQPLCYSGNCFGTADAISFRKNLLRIHDLKTGTTQASINQLLIYAALFCLEYGYQPNMIKIELRIYQSDEIFVHTPEPEEVRAIMEKIVLFDGEIVNLISEVEL